MLDYTSIKTLAKSIMRPVTDLLALSKVNDPFYAGVGRRGDAAQWFAGIYRDHGGGGVTHLRRIHYRLVSPPDGVRFLLPNGREYQNTENDWGYLCWASLAARYLDLIPFDGLVDKRNDPPLIYAKPADPHRKLQADCEIVSKWTSFAKPELPPLPWLYANGFDVIQDYIVEIWIEKSTQNDWLDPLCRRRGVNLMVGTGEQSETRARELALRSARYKAPVRVLYLSDFDPGGRSMPKAVARKVEFTIHKHDLDVDFQLIPVVLTPEQCRQYNLPRTPIKETERRKDTFEQTFGVGATELDALEALHPGEMARIVGEELDNWLDPVLSAAFAGSKPISGWVASKSRSAFTRNTPSRSRSCPTASTRSSGNSTSGSGKPMSFGAPLLRSSKSWPPTSPISKSRDPKCLARPRGSCCSIRSATISTRWIATIRGRTAASRRSCPHECAPMASSAAAQLDAQARRRIGTWQLADRSAGIGQAEAPTAHERGAAPPGRGGARTLQRRHHEMSGRKAAPAMTTRTFGDFWRMWCAANGLPEPAKRPHVVPEPIPIAPPQRPRRFVFRPCDRCGSNRFTVHPHAGRITCNDCGRRSRWSSRALIEAA
jgi:hypothetical protein